MVLIVIFSKSVHVMSSTGDADYNIIILFNNHVMPRTLEVMGNHVMYDQLVHGSKGNCVKFKFACFVLLTVSEETKK